MNTRPNNRVRSGRSVLRRWLCGALPQTCGHNDSRRLLCEQLERRYALHGMGWSDDSFWPGEPRETRDSFDDGASARYVSMHSMRSDFYSTYRFSAEVESESGDRVSLKSSDGVVDLIDQTDAIEHFEHDCDHPRGSGRLRAEGEGGSSNDPFRRTSGRELTGSFQSPVNAGLDSASDSHFDKPEEKLVDSTSLSGAKPIITDIPVRMDIPSSKPAYRPAPSAPNGNITSSGPTRTISVEVQLHEFMGSANRQSDTNSIGTNQNTQILSGPSGKSSFVSEPANRVSATPAQVSNSKTELTTETAPTTASLRSNLSTATNSLATSTNKHESLTGQATTNTWQGFSKSNDSSSTRLSEEQTEGLLDKLRSVIDELASTRQSEKSDVGNDSRLSHTMGQGEGDDFFQTARRPSLINDGMLELAAATEELDSSAQLVAGSGSPSAAQHRSQLLASLELTREFELAGQTVDTLQSVVDPAAQVQAAQRAARAFTPSSDSPDLAAADSRSASTSSTEGPIWQRSLLPLSFLAAGLLLTKKRRQTLLQGLPLMPRLSRTKSD